MTLETYIRAQMARFAIREGQRYGGVKNMLAIGHVLRNRVFAGWGDWLEVVERAPDKRAHSSEAILQAMKQNPMNLRTGDVRILLNKIDEIYTREDATDLTGGALFYMDQGVELLPWFRNEVLNRPEEHQRSAHVGPVWFFK
jgi:hypothetical protein